VVEAFELTKPHQGEPLVIVLGSIFSMKEGRQVRYDQGLGFAAKDVGDPDIAAVRLGLGPIESDDGPGKRLARRRATS
jgi:hypothetical protein